MPEMKKKPSKTKDMFKENSGYYWKFEGNEYF